MQLTGKYRWLAVVNVFIVFSLLLGGCSSQTTTSFVSANVVESLRGAANPALSRALAPRPFSFPLDHGVHPEYRTEWWYYTGNLQAADGGQFGYQLTFFRSALTPAAVERASALATNQIYMAHFAVTDAASGQHRSFERFSRGGNQSNQNNQGGLAGASGDPAFSVWLDDWSAQEITPGVMRVQAAASDKSGPLAIDFTLKVEHPPVLHGDEGLSQKGPEAGNASYYYSLVQITSTGTITTPTGASAVTGVSWMDHEFGTSALSKDAVGWDWYSVQLANGAALMFATVRNRTGSAANDFVGTFVQPDGTQSQLATKDFNVTATGQWTSPRTGASYPSGWQVTIPSHELSLTLTPLVEDQEMQVAFVYWEGAVNAAGRLAGNAITGRGYVELTGYSAGAGQYQR